MRDQSLAQGRVRDLRQGQGSVRNERADQRLGSRGRVVRWTETGFEMQCLACREFWPITTEFWRIPSIRRCFACWRERARVAQATVRLDPGIYAEHIGRYRAERRARRSVDNSSRSGERRGDSAHDGDRRGNATPTMEVSSSPNTGAAPMTLQRRAV